LIERLSDLALQGNYKVLLVFDAQYQGQAWVQKARERQVTILFTQKGQTADQFIVTWLKKRPHRGGVIVITRDRELVAMLRKLRVRILPDLSSLEAAIADGAGLISHQSQPHLVGEQLSAKSFEALRGVVRK
jgi:hypothetical protein